MTKTPNSHSIVVGNTPYNVANVWSRILSEIEANDFSEDDVFAVHLALEEAFANAVEHGNKAAKKEEIKIDYSVGPEKVEISVTDQGGGFDPNSVPDPRYGENLYKTDGRGLLLMRSYMDAVEFNKRGNSVNMVRHKKKQRKFA